MLNIEDIRHYALSKEGVTEGFPFGESALVFKTNGKMFLLLSLEAQPLSLNAKCDPEKAVLLREEFPAVLPGYHMNKKHWNTVLIDGSLPDRKIREIIDHSYDLVRKKK
ncbi:MAG TPA: MmcQ/YjbR family DNA-binding protein [Edaphocola sp.]|nr:MmcQ/YjbR family DNA-binding protein [Edaphocola sp.]